MVEVCTWFVANPTFELEQHEIERVRKGLQSRYHWQPSWQLEYYSRSEEIWLLLQSTKLTHFHTLWLLLPLRKSVSWMSLLLKKKNKPSLECTFHPKDLNLKSLNSYISVLHDFGVGKSVSNSWNLLAGSTAVLLERLFQNRSCAKHWFKHFSTLVTL